MNIGKSNNNDVINYPKFSFSNYMIEDSNHVTKHVSNTHNIDENAHKAIASLLLKKLKMSIEESKIKKWWNEELMFKKKYAQIETKITIDGKQWCDRISVFMIDNNCNRQD